MVVPVYVWFSCPVPDVSVRFLPDAIVVSPLRDIAPVPVEKVPVPV